MSPSIAPAATAPSPQSPDDSASDRKRPRPASLDADDDSVAPKRPNVVLPSEPAATQPAAEAAAPLHVNLSDPDPSAGSKSDPMAVTILIPTPPSTATLKPDSSNGSVAPTIGPDLPPAPAQDLAAQQAQQQPVQTVQMKALIVTQDASIIIGKGGKHINEIREKAGARATISEAVPGSAERILIVQGQLDAVSKAFGLIVRRINDEPFDTPSIQGSRAVTIRFIIANARMGGVIGKSGSKIKEIQAMSGARLEASEALLPGSTERILCVSGVADAIHIAVYYIGLVLLENADRQPANTVYRPGGARVDNTMNVNHLGGAVIAGPRGGVRLLGGGIPGYGMSPPGYGMPAMQLQHSPLGSGGYPSTAYHPGSQIQQIFIPNAVVGAIIGKGGQKINEIRHMSGTHIKIMEHGEGGQAVGVNERLVTITGMPTNIQAAVGMLRQKLELERVKQAQTQPILPN